MGLLVVAAGPNKVLTFAGGPAVYELEWNRISIGRREQPYVSAIAGIIHGSSHLALLFLGWSIPETLRTRANWNQMTPTNVFLDGRWDVPEELETLKHLFCVKHKQLISGWARWDAAARDLWHAERHIITLCSCFECLHHFTNAVKWAWQADISKLSNKLNWCWRVSAAERAKEN